MKSMTLQCAAVLAFVAITSALLPDRSHRHDSHRQLELDDNSNRQHVWDWLDRLHSERRNRSGANKSLASFVTPPAGPDDSIEPSRMANSKKRTRDAGAVDSSVEVDYADDAGSSDDYFDQMKPVTTSGKASDGAIEPKARSNTSGSLSSMLKFSSNRTSATNFGTLQRLHRLKNPKKRLTSSVLNLPPVNQDWSFMCPPGKSGYFADQANDCRVYYVCSSDRGERQRFVCPTGTRFNEDAKNCDWWDKVVCGEETEQ